MSDNGWTKTWPTPAESADLGWEESPSSLSGLEAWAATLIKSLQESCKEGASSDLTVRYHGSEHKFHKVIVCGQSGFFAKALKNFKEAQTNTVELNEGSAEVLDALFSYITTSNYQYQDKGEPGPWALTNRENSIHAELMFHSEVYAAADFYDISPLKPLAASKFDKVRSDKIPLAVLKHVYESTPDGDRGLRDVVLRIELSSFRERHGMGDDSVDYVVDVPDLARDLLRGLGTAFAFIHV
ncbi:hypothetical protein FKW77_006061 [Venturia effusa]|uniref:BTB domain-containing protein n=1 Tax=Venturia effusa TaxID=50376 RepID=A0A517LP26_9PEZI|nr:hypothetical protein FKW77_006061 [Venturia effusa]